MSKVLVDEANLTAIGNAIRAKNESTTKYKPSEMANAISNIKSTIEYTTGDLQVVSPDNWSYKIVQTANQTISGNPSAKTIDHNNGTYSSALSFNAKITPYTGYVPGTIQKSADKANHVYTITATNAEEIAGMVENGYAKVYEDGDIFYYEDNYSDELYGLAGDILVAGMKNTDLSNTNFYSLVYRNNFITKFKNTFITGAGNNLLNECSALTSVDLPNLTSVGNGLLNECSALTSVSLPNLTTAGNHLLSSCNSLTAVGFPNLKSVGGTFLSNSYKLQSIYLRSTTMCTLGGITTLPSSVSIYVPASLIDSYKTADYWKKYASNFKPLTGKMLADVTLNLRGANATDIALDFVVQFDPLNPRGIEGVTVWAKDGKYFISFVVSEEYQNCIIKLSTGADYSENINISYKLDGSDKTMEGVTSKNMFDILKPIAESGGAITLKITVVG